jgi:NTP pyrophosphatase (non-canonical NTP hydrolase)
VTFEEYQRAVARTQGNNTLATLALGIAGEGGELCDLIKKHLAQGHTLDGGKLHEELGDLLWYVAALANLLEFDLAIVAEANDEKLKARYPNGFEVERSVKR